MPTISLKLPEALNLELTREARRRRTSKSAVVRDCVERSLKGGQTNAAESCFDLASDLAGCVEGRRDLATNPKYLADFGE